MVSRKRSSETVRGTILFWVWTKWKLDQQQVGTNHKFLSCVSPWVLQAMRIILLPPWRCLQIPRHVLPQYSTLSSHKEHVTLKSRSLDRALGIVDLISSEKVVSSAGQNHLRLIQDFLQTDSDHLGSKDFHGNISENGIPHLLDKLVVEHSLLSKEASHTTRRATLLSKDLSLCSSALNFLGGIQYHCLAVKTGLISNVYVGSSLISLYGNCGFMSSAYKVFEEMPVRNLVSWTAVIVGFAQEWQIDECLRLYNMMRNLSLKPNDFTLTGILRACMGCGALGQGRGTHCQVIQMGFDSYIHIANAVISMYCKCGSVKDALYIFNRMPSKDVISWNSMIAGYAQNGLAICAIGLFEEMMKDKVKPDAITFLGVLSSCRHAGLVEEGRKLFGLMSVHGVKLELDHYSCVVDLLGRAGLLEEARDLILKMPIKPNAVIWGSLLSSCRLHGSIWIGIEAAEGRLVMEPECAATHVQLANLYASARRWDQAARVRKLMKDKGLRTNPGYSWVEVKNKVFRFGAEDWSNRKMAEIPGAMECLSDHMRSLGYVPEMQEEEVC